MRRIPAGETPVHFFGWLVRRAIDEILMLRPRQYLVEHLSAPEQTYIGMRVEILVKEGLDLGTGRRGLMR